MASVAESGEMACSGVRFTHVADNAIILERLRRWCERREVVRLHSVDTMFYVQSAIESAQLLLTALLSPADDIFRLHVINDLDWPVSPLVNALEAPTVEPSVCPEVDVIPMRRTQPRAASLGVLKSGSQALGALREACSSGDDAVARRAQESINRQLLAATAGAAPPEELSRVVQLTEAHRPTMSEEHLLIDDVFRAALTASAAESASSAASASLPSASQQPSRPASSPGEQGMSPSSPAGSLLRRSGRRDDPDIVRGTPEAA